MALTFASASSQYLSHASALLTAVPLTAACWFNSDNDANEQNLFGIGDTGAANSDRFQMNIDGSAPGDPVTVITRAGGSAAITTTTAAYSINTWHHACGVWAAVDSRTAYLDGGNSATNTTSRTPAGLDVTYIGARASQTPSGYMRGRIAEMGVWNVVLDAAEIAALAKAVCPLLIRPDSLVMYCPMIGRYDPEIELIGGANFTLVNAPTNGDHCRVFNPRRRYPNSFAAASTPAGSVALRRMRVLLAPEPVQAF